jgi:hypothetical protein
VPPPPGGQPQEPHVKYFIFSDMPMAMRNRKRELSISVPQIEVGCIPKWEEWADFGGGRNLYKPKPLPELPPDWTVCGKNPLIYLDNISGSGVPA